MKSQINRQKKQSEAMRQVDKRKQNSHINILAALFQMRIAQLLGKVSQLIICHQLFIVKITIKSL
jgi:hypothetical protein